MQWWTAYTIYKGCIISMVMSGLKIDIKGSPVIADKLLNLLILPSFLSHV